ncbi:peptidase C39 family protein [Kiritimatiellota bacterium B12222]|nr:peptidase C39 family protein [Kiritimatiellota bacterium B12222]
MSPFSLRPGRLTDVERLLTIETQSFSKDRFSKRRFTHWLSSPHALFQVAEDVSGCVQAYGMVVLQQGTRLSRLYSLAVHPDARKQGAGTQLLQALEQAAVHAGRLAMRVEVESSSNEAHTLLLRQGYHHLSKLDRRPRKEAHILHFQKRIRFPEQQAIHGAHPWYQQSTPFTCGPASLLMAMAAVDKQHPITIEEELDIWREATTIFMTSGHGGCHPLGLALAARSRHFQVDVWLNQKGPLFLEGVRSSEKKEILKVVHQQFVKKCRTHQVTIHRSEIQIEHIIAHIAQGHAVLVLISTYRFNGQKAPHWVQITAIDQECLYVHDPDPDEGQRPIDCQHVPIARSDFDRMCVYGSARLKTALILSKIDFEH